MDVLDANKSVPAITQASKDLNLGCKGVLERWQPDVEVRRRSAADCAACQVRAESDFNLPSLVRVTKAKRQIFTARLSVEKTSSTFPSKPELRDPPRRFRDERWPAHIPER
jgi:hypothetical protein